MDFKFWHLQLVIALGGKCSKCGCAVLSRLEIHDRSGEHHGYGNPQRQKDVLEYKRYRKIPKDRILLCDECHDIAHGSERIRIKKEIEKQLKELEKEP